MFLLISVVRASPKIPRAFYSINENSYNLFKVLFLLLHTPFDLSLLQQKKNCKQLTTSAQQEELSVL